MFGHDKIKEIINLQNQLVTDEITKREFAVKEKDKDLEDKIIQSISSDLNEAIRVKLKQERSTKSSEAYQKAFDELSVQDDFNEKEFKEIFDSLKKSFVRDMMFNDKVRNMLNASAAFLAGKKKFGKRTTLRPQAVYDEVARQVLADRGLKSPLGKIDGVPLSEYRP